MPTNNRRPATRADVDRLVRAVGDELHAVRDQIHAVDQHLAGALDCRAAALTRGVAVLIGLWSVAAALILLPPG